MLGFGHALKEQMRFGPNAWLSSFRALSHMSFLKPNEGAVVAYKRLGRGQGSGLGKTSGRGQKGQKARGKVPKFMEGGQTPYYKRFPLIGMTRAHRQEYAHLNLERIQEFWDRNRIPLQPGETLDIHTMRRCGLVTGSLKSGVKILANGKGDYSVPLSIEACRASMAAIELIEKNGHNFTARYFTNLSLRAHVNPEKFILKKGYLPLPARPTHTRHIEYYSSEEKRGYLLKDRSLMLDQLSAHKSSKKTNLSTLNRLSALARQLESASSKRYSDYGDNQWKLLKDVL